MEAPRHLPTRPPSHTAATRAGVQRARARILRRSHLDLRPNTKEKISSSALGSPVHTPRTPYLYSPQRKATVLRMSAPAYVRLPLCYTRSTAVRRAQSRPLARRQTPQLSCRRSILTFFGSFLTASSLLTLFPKYFSSFVRTTCSLSVSTQIFFALSLGWSLSASFRLHS